MVLRRDAVFPPESLVIHFPHMGALFRVSCTSHEIIEDIQKATVIGLTWKALFALQIYFKYNL